MCNSFLNKICKYYEYMDKEFINEQLEHFKEILTIKIKPNTKGCLCLDCKVNEWQEIKYNLNIIDFFKRQ